MGENDRELGELIAGVKGLQHEINGLSEWLRRMEVKIDGLSCNDCIGRIKVAEHQTSIQWWFIGAAVLGILASAVAGLFS